MNIKLISLVLAWASALGVSYFAFDILISLGDWGAVWVSSPYILFIALLVSLVPVSFVWAGIVLIEQAKTTKGQVVKLLITSVLAWAWLYIGAIYLALLRLQ
jgi:hypothetical protein